MSTRQKERNQRLLFVSEKENSFTKTIVSKLGNEFQLRELYAAPEGSSALLPLKIVRIIKGCMIIFSKFKPNKAIIYGESLIAIWIVVLWIRVFRDNTEIIVFRYDIENVRPISGLKSVLGHTISRLLEKFCLINSDKIIHKGLMDELKFLKYYKRIKSKPHYLFREFLDKKLIQVYNPHNKLSKKDNEFHLVYNGATLFLHDIANSESIWKFYPKLTKQKIHLHIYSDIPEDAIVRFRELEKDDPYIHFEGFFDQKILVGELTKYDYGTHILGYENWKRKYNWEKSIFSNKYYDHICAFLPTICSSQFEAAVEFIEKKGIGFSIPYDDVQNLGRILKEREKDYGRYIRNIQKYISNDRGYARLIDFIKS